MLRPSRSAPGFTQDPDSARLVFDLSRPVEARVYALSSPDRIIVELPEVNFQLDPSVGRADGRRAALVKAFRFGQLAPREIAVSSSIYQRPACPTQVGSRPIVDGTPASRLKIELRPCEAADFAALERPSWRPPPAARPFASALRCRSSCSIPAHGGVDGGARGIGGACRKRHWSWEFCREFKRQLEATGRYTVAMTREGDEYVDLDDRVAIARDAKRRSSSPVHADALSEAADVGGSTVYTARRAASDAEAARIAARENAAGQAPRKEKGSQDDPGVTDILFDLKRRETRAYAHMFLARAGRAPALRRQAQPQSGALGAFVVLKAPEFPSGAARTGLSLERTGRAGPVVARMAGESGRPPWSRRSTRSLPGPASPAEARRSRASRSRRARPATTLTR